MVIHVLMSYHHIPKEMNDIVLITSLYIYYAPKYARDQGPKYSPQEESLYRGSPCHNIKGCCCKHYNAYAALSAFL
jgi:hypothetical protein